MSVKGYWMEVESAIQLDKSWGIQSCFLHKIGSGVPGVQNVPGTEL